MDSVLYESGFPAELVTNGSVVVVKTHEEPASVPNCERAVLLIRNPFKAIVSYFNYEKSETKNKHIGVVRAMFFKTAGKKLKRFSPYEYIWAFH